MVRRAGTCHACRTAPGRVERRSRERITLELAGLGLGTVLQPGDGESAPLRAPAPHAPGPDEFSSAPSVIAHEAANPLTAALVMLEASLDSVREATGLEPSVRAQILADLATVAEGTERAAAFLRAVQDRGRGTLARHERFDAVKVVRSCVRLEEPLLKRKGVGLEVHAPPEEIYLHGDPNALFQVLTNVIRNAADASAGRQTPIRIDVEQLRDMLHVRVRDKGVGIPSEYLSRVFEAGFTTKGFGSGAGMGLTVVKDIAQRMFGGHVKIESAVGAGTTVMLVFPVPPQRGLEARRATT